ncbi:MAG: cytochrome-c peroxidase [Pedobacter sp.]|nr:MAG: cytochrome-c peroxidase [Pedobacter sp.]
MRKWLKGLVLISAVVCIASPYIDSPSNFTEIELGEKLFFDPILSSNRKISCSSCHKPEFAFADTSRISLGVFDRTGERNSPSTMNLKSGVAFFWDGRASTLEEQAIIPIENPVEMNLPIKVALMRLTENQFYREAFQKIYHGKPTARNLGKALAVFQNSLETNHSPFDDWKNGENEAAVSTSVKRGFALFNGSANCVKCHFGSDFSNVEFRNIGLFNGKELKDSGRAAVTKLRGDLGKFKIGPLRNVALTAPYMHNGMFKSLEEVVDYYDDPDKIIPNSINRDSLMARPLNLSKKDKQDLIAFLRSLTDKRFTKN